MQPRQSVVYYSSNFHENIQNLYERGQGVYQLLNCKPTHSLMISSPNLLSFPGRFGHIVQHHTFALRVLKKSIHHHRMNHEWVNGQDAGYKYAREPIPTKHTRKQLTGSKNR